MSTASASRIDLIIYLIVSVALISVPTVIAITAGASHFQAECDRLVQNLVDPKVNQTDKDYIKQFIHTHCHADYKLPKQDL